MTFHLYFLYRPFLLTLFFICHFLFPLLYLLYPLFLYTLLSPFSPLPLLTHHLPLNQPSFHTLPPPDPPPPYPPTPSCSPSPFFSPSPTPIPASLPFAHIPPSPPTPSYPGIRTRTHTHLPRGSLSHRTIEHRVVWVDERSQVDCCKGIAHLFRRPRGRGEGEGGTDGDVSILSLRWGEGWDGGWGPGVSEGGEPA